MGIQDGLPMDYQTILMLILIQSGNKQISLVHNGIIENYAVLKQELEQRGHQFLSETDTEVLVHLIEDIQEKSKLSLFEAVRVALSEVVGAYAIVVIDQDKSQSINCGKKVKSTCHRNWRK